MSRLLIVSAFGALIIVVVARLVRSSEVWSDFAERNYTLSSIALIALVAASIAISWYTSARWLSDVLFMVAAPFAAMANVEYRRRRGFE